LTLGQIRLERGDEREAVRRFAIEWFRATRHSRLLWLVRELNPPLTADSRYFWLTLHGRIPQPYDGPQGFWIRVDAVADSTEEALAFLNELMPPDPAKEYEIDKVRSEPYAEGPKGIYLLPGRSYYRE
jgi:hypothetical protein